MFPTTLFPTLIRRAAAVTAAAAFLAATTVLLLADRSTALVGSVQALVIDLGRTIERTFEIDVLDRGDIPGTTAQLGHAGLWGTGMFLFGWILRARVPMLFTALVVAGASVIFEAAQPVLSATRRFEPSDAIANMTGITTAAVILACVLWLLRRPSAMDPAYDNTLL